MERRSGRGRQDTGKSSTPNASGGGGKRGGVNTAGSKSEPRPPAAVPINQNNKSPSVVPASEVPDIGAEEVVLNRRGMPARQRKRNRLYFDDDMITPENWGTAIARNAKKVKAEPVDVTTDDDDEGEEILGDLPDVHISSSPASSGKQSGARSRPSPSPTKAIPGKQTPKRVQEPVPEKSSKNKASTPAGGRTPVSERGSPVRSGNRQPSLQLLTTTAPPEKSPTKPAPKTATKTNSVPTPVKTPAGKVITPKIKPDPDAPPPVPLPTSRKKDMDRWGKLVQRANNLKKDREEREAQKQASGQKGSTKDQERSPQKDKDNQDNNYDKRSPKKDQQRQQQEKERERLQKEKEKQQQLQLQKEKEERLAKERLLKEKEKKVIIKEKKRDHRESITVLPPVVKLASRATAYLTGEDQQHHQQQPIPPQQLMAVIKIDDSTTQVIDKRVAHDISIRLRNLLKLPKAHKWVCYEWFYSNIDKVLFEGENDFQICLKESFPALKARKLTRTEWTKIRRLMGKPRRCSQAFFDEEREELARRRAKIRQIQQRKVTDFNYKELPDEIPLQLVIGTKVTARLRRPQDGLFTGTIEGVDTSNNTYRITFDRPGLGTHSIPDYEVLSNDTPETVSTSSFALKIPRRSGGFTVGTFKFQNPVLLGDQPEGFPKSPFPADGMLGGFPIRLLDMIVRLSKLLKAKREKIMTLKELNVEAEKMKSYGRPYNSEYRTRYARCVLDLDSMNKEMAMYLEGIQTYCLEITNDHGSTTQMVIPEHILDNSRQEASMVVSTYNCKANRTLVHNQKIVALVHHLTSLMLQVRALSTSDRNLYELKSLKDTIKEVKASLEGKNLQCFQNKIEIPMNRIIAGLCVSQPKAY